VSRPEPRRRDDHQVVDTATIEPTRCLRTLGEVEGKWVRGPPKMLRLELLNVNADLPRARGLRPQVFEVRPRRSLGLGARDNVRSLGAPGTGAARRAQRLTERHYDALRRWSACVGVDERGRPVMEFDVFGPRAGPGFAFVLTSVRASGRGVPSDVERLEEALAVALTGRDVTIDLREVEKLGPEGIAGLSRASAILDGWDSGLLYLLVTTETPVWEELGASPLPSAPRVSIVEVGSE
jgi:hypothetical protein